MSRVGLQDIAIQDIWLMREGGENGLAYAVVYVQRDGVWYEAIRELIDSNFSHCISANGLASEMCKPAAWLNKAEALINDPNMFNTAYKPDKELSRQLGDSVKARPHLEM